jgi:hypothetical protein
MMEYLITMAAYLLILIFFLPRWCDNFAEKLIEKLKEIGPAVKAVDEEVGFSPPAGKAGGHIEAYVIDDGVAYALTVFNGKFYRASVKDLCQEPPDPESEPPSSNGWFVFSDVAATAAYPQTY